jgi:hypothetical protein
VAADQEAAHLSFLEPEAQPQTGKGLLAVAMLEACWVGRVVAVRAQTVSPRPTTRAQTEELAALGLTALLMAAAAVVALEVAETFQRAQVEQAAAVEGQNHCLRLYPRQEPQTQAAEAEAERAKLVRQVAAEVES